MVGPCVGGVLQIEEEEEEDDELDGLGLGLVSGGKEEAREPLIDEEKRKEQEQLLRQQQEQQQEPEWWIGKNVYARWGKQWFAGRVASANKTTNKKNVLVLFRDRSRKLCQIQDLVEDFSPSLSQLYVGARVCAKRAEIDKCFLEGKIRSLSSESVMVVFDGQTFEWVPFDQLRLLPPSS